jgi:hypothetical protein
MQIDLETKRGETMQVTVDLSVGIDAREEAAILAFIPTATFSRAKTDPDQCLIFLVHEDNHDVSTIEAMVVEYLRHLQPAIHLLRTKRKTLRVAAYIEVASIGALGISLSHSVLLLLASDGFALDAMFFPCSEDDG